MTTGACWWYGARKIIRTFIFTLSVCLLYAEGASAGEFGNVFGSVEKESRAASATALDALALIFGAFAARERGDLELGEERLREAADQMDRAAALMKQIAVPSGEDPEVLVPLSYDQQLNDLLRASGIHEVSTLFTIYRRFADETANMAYRLSEIAQIDPTDPTKYTRIVDQLSVYLSFADLVSEVARKASL